MRPICRWYLSPLISVLAVALALSATAEAFGAPVDVIGNLSTSDFNSYIAPQSYRDWGNEPCIAVNPANPQQMIISTFGYGSWISSATAQLWYSTNGGASWAIAFAVPTQNGYGFFVDDQNYAYDGAGVLHGVILVQSSAGALSVSHGSTTNVNSSAAWNWTSPAIASVNVDQPWIAISGASVAVAYDNFNSGFTFSEERVAISTDNGATFGAALNRAVCSPGRVNTSIVNPGLRVAADAQGDFFILCGVRTNNDISGVPLVNYRLNRYSAGSADWDFTTASPDPIGALAITNGSSRQGNNGSYSFGGINYLLGNTTAIAVNTNGSRVYVVYGLSDASAIGHLYLQKLVASGTNLIKSGPALALSSTNFSAALPSVAVATNGTVAVLFDEFDGTNFHVRLAVSLDEGASIAASGELYSFATNGMVLGYGTTSHNRLLGDFARMLANVNSFYGTFAGRGNVLSGNNNTTNFIVPFFFSLDVSVTQPTILSIAPIASDKVKIDFGGSPGTTYYVQAATDLAPPIAWQTLSTNIASISGQWSYTNLITGFPRRYYRASLAP